MNTDYLKWGAIAIIGWMLLKEYISDVYAAAQSTYHTKENFGA